MEEKKNQNNSNEIDKDSYEKIAFETSEGVEEYYVLEQTMLGGINYLVVTDDVEGEEGSFLILKEIDDSEEGYVSYEIVDDDNELESVITLFDNLIEDFDLDLY